MSAVPLTLRVWPQQARHLLRQLLWLETRTGSRSSGCSGGCINGCCRCASRQQQYRGLHGRDVTEWEHADTLYPQSRGQVCQAIVVEALTPCVSRLLEHLNGAMPFVYSAHTAAHVPLPFPQQRQFNARVERALTSAIHANLHLKAALVDSYGFAVQVSAPAATAYPVRFVSRTPSLCTHAAPSRTASHLAYTP